MDVGREAGRDGGVRGGEVGGGCVRWCKEGWEDEEKQDSWVLSKGMGAGFRLPEATPRKQDYATFLMTVFLLLILIIVIMSIMADMVVEALSWVRGF